jgi:hypothetical protein
MRLSSVTNQAGIPGTDPETLASGEVTLEKQGVQNEQSIAAQLASPLPSDLRPEGTGIMISQSV